METFSTWWSGLQVLNQWFFIAAAFFSVFFIWQIIMAFVGLGMDADIGMHADTFIHHDSPHDASASVDAFKLLSVRSVIAFFTLFTWAGALYMSRNMPVTRSLTFGLLWGAIAMTLVSLLLYGMRRMTETGNMNISSCIGSTGVVYLDIPAGGNGEVRVVCSGIMTHFKARIAGGQPAKAGTEVRVVKVCGPNAVEVEIKSQST